jgi:ATP-dependent DNA helicase RecQ
VQTLPEPVALPALDAVVDRHALEVLAAAHPAALGATRQRARFLCGITSPAASRAKLGRGALFGAAAMHRFADVFGWCAQEGAER